MPDKTYILHIDTSADKCTVALAADGWLVASVINGDARNHASVINTNINRVLEEGNIKLADIAAIAVCGGPGSYTGLRIGLATAKGICYAHDKPLMQHDKLLLLCTEQAYNHFFEYEYYGAILRAREKEYFIGIYDTNLNSILPAHHILEENLPEILEKYGQKCLFSVPAAGEGVNMQINTTIKTIENQHVNLGSWGEYVFKQYNCNDFVNLSTAEPIYLKHVYTSKPRKT